MKKLMMVLLMLVLPSLLLAHVYLMEMDPAPGDVLTTPPKMVTIGFVGSVEPAFSRIEVFDPTGKKVSKQTTCIEDDTVMQAELEDNLIPGEYKVAWICMSLDGHKQKGEYVFTIK